MFIISFVYDVVQIYTFLLINCKDVAFILRINEIDVTKLLRCFCVPKLIVILFHYYVYQMKKINIWKTVAIVSLVIIVTISGIYLYNDGLFRRDYDLDDELGGNIFPSAIQIGRAHV